MRVKEALRMHKPMERLWTGVEFLGSLPISATEDYILWFKNLIQVDFDEVLL